MMTKQKNMKTWFQAVGLLFLTLLLFFSAQPVQTQAFSLLNGSGNDGYYLSITNDPSRTRVVPVIIYDQHNKRQTAKAFLEWNDIKVYYANFDYNKKGFKDIPATDSKDTFKDWARDATNRKDFNGDSPLAWTFPAFGGNNDAEDYSATQADLDRATWVSDTLIHDFNSAINFVHRASIEYGHGTKELNDDQFANLINKVAQNARRAVQKSEDQELKWKGVTIVFEAGTDGKIDRPPKGVMKTAYVTLSVKQEPKEKVTLVEHVHKGYRSAGGTEYDPMYHQLPKQFQDLANGEGEYDDRKPDVRYLNWMLIALQSNSNWAIDDLTFNTISSINKTNKLEQWVSDLGSNLLSGLRQMLGLFETTDLIMNGGNRGTDAYFKGIMPQTWMTSADILHWISYAIAWMLIIGSIVKLLVERNLAAVNPSARVDMINGIKNLMIVGFALSIFDLLFVGITELNFLIVDMLNATGVGIETFGTTPISNGFLASIIVGTIFFCLDVYFNFFYISRALMIAILYAVGPLYVASIAYGEKYRQIFGNYVKEMIGNVFVQSFQAILVVFFVGISITGNLRTIETLVLLFCFIPMTKFFKESIGASSSTSDALTGSALGAGAGMAAGLIGSRFVKGAKGGGQKGGGGEQKGGSGTLSGGADIGMKSGSSYSASTNSGSPGSMTNVAGGKAGGSGSMAGKIASGAGKVAKTGLKAGATAGVGLVGAGLVAGGAATGMRGASQIGGFMVGSATSKAGAGATHAAQAGYGKMQDSFQGRKDSKSTAGFNQGIDQDYGSPQALNVTEQPDGSQIETYDKGSFSNSTGITSMRDLDNIGDEMEVGTSYVDGQGFQNGANNALVGSNYERNMGDMVDAFKNQDRDKMEHYQAKGINDVRVDRNNGKVSMVLDKKRAGIHGVHNSGNQLHLHRTPIKPNRSTSLHDSNPLKDITQQE